MKLHMRLEQYRNTRKYGSVKQKKHASDQTFKLLESQLAKIIKSEKAYQKKLGPDFDIGSLSKKEKQLEKKYQVRIKKIKKELSKPENSYDFVVLCHPDEVDDMVCLALTSKLYKCRGKVKYIHKDMNPKGKRSKMKKNVPLCNRHMSQVLESSDLKTPPHGFMFESDLYTD